MNVDDYDAVVYDLDGTLADLAVDWDAVAADIRSVLVERGVATPEGQDLWTMLERSEAAGHRPAVEAVIADHERPGAQNSTRLPLADGLPRDRPVGVCSLNCEAACRLALEVHGLADRVDAVVGRDSVATEKPDPEPLLETVRRLEVPPERTLFVGDSPRDEECARRAGTDFRYV
jgi:phosphoglycolate phosphatase